MKVDWSFPKQIALTLVIAGCLGGYPLLKFGTSETILAVIMGAILTTLNVLIGYAAIEYSFSKSTTTFFKFVLGGMGVRMIVMALVLVLLIKAFHLPAGTLVLSMGALYIIFLTLEVVFIQKKVNLRQRT